MNKRLLSIFLSLCMVLTLLPFSAIADENDTYDYSGGEITSLTRGELADYLLKLTGDILDAKDMTPEEFCKTYGFMVGDADGNFSAERVLTRAELAAILLRVDNELMSSDDREAGPEQQNIN